MREYLEQLREENRREAEARKNRIYGVLCVITALGFGFVFAAGIMGVI